MVKISKAFDLPEVEEFEATSGGTDLTEFEGKKVKIVGYQVIDGTSTFDENGNQMPAGKTRPVKLLKVVTEQVTEFDGPDGKIPVSASELINMKYVDGKWGISRHEKSKAMKLMKKLKVASLSDIVGKDVMLRIRETPNGGTFLGFVI